MTSFTDDPLCKKVQGSSVFLSVDCGLQAIQSFWFLGWNNHSCWVTKILLIASFKTTYKALQASTLSTSASLHFINLEQIFGKLKKYSQSAKKCFYLSNIKQYLRVVKKRLFDGLSGFKDYEPHNQKIKNYTWESLSQQIFLG